MSGFELAEKLSGWAELASSGVLQTLTNSFLNISAGRNVEELLIGFSILHHSGGFPFHGKNHWPFGLSELFHEVAGSPPEGCQRVDIRRDVNHACSRSEPIKALGY